MYLEENFIIESFVNLLFCHVISNRDQTLTSKQKQNIG